MLLKQPQTGLKCLRLPQVHSGPQFKTPPLGIHVQDNTPSHKASLPKFESRLTRHGLSLYKSVDLSISHMDHLF